MLDQGLESLAHRFRGHEIGHQILWLPITTSTNRYALELPESEAEHGTIVLAYEQTAGRGRQRRGWHSAAGKGIYCTILLRPEQTELIPLYGYAMAVAIYDALEPFVSQGLEIKWPNDILVNGKKLCGILGESSARGGSIDRVALGFSINLYHQPEQFPAEIQHSATSLIQETEHQFKPSDLLTAVILQLNNRCQQLKGNPSALLDSLQRRASIINGRFIKIETAGEIFEGKTAGLLADGSLKLILPNGEEMALKAGDIHLLDY